MNNATVASHLLLRVNFVFPLCIQNSWGTLLSYSPNSCLYRLNGFCHFFGIQYISLADLDLALLSYKRYGPRYWYGGEEGRVTDVLVCVCKKQMKKKSRCMKFIEYNSEKPCNRKNEKDRRWKLSGWVWSLRYSLVRVAHA